MDDHPLRSAALMLLIVLALALGHATSATAEAPASHVKIGSALQDSNNPIVSLFDGERLDLWSLRPIVEPRIPNVEEAERCRNPIDAFVMDRLSKEGISYSPEAEKGALARRVYFDLTGLPPTPEEMQSYLADNSPDCYEKLVDRLLASRAFAEHWARIWLDVVRYSDTAGYDWDPFLPHAWRYRNYVIDAFESDKPFDQFIREQLAGDEMVEEISSPADQEKIVATGFLRVGPFDYSAKLFKEEDQNHAAVLADVTETTSAAFLGMTMACCRCHDHKTEPLSQKDHYRLRAFFANVDFECEVELDPPSVIESVKQNNESIASEMKQLSSKLKKLKEESAEFSQMSKRLKKLESKRKDINMGMAAKENSTDAPATYILELGSVDSPMEEVAPGFPSLFDPSVAKPAKVLRKTSTGRRTALANWIVSQENPLTARVTVNRLWAGMFGSGIVATPNDFGYSGARPVNQPLLDWMATKLMREKWSVRKTLRRIACSATYRQTAYPPTAIRLLGESRDASNTLTWRSNPKRLRAEMLRDSMLQVAGNLDRSVVGPPIWPDLPAELKNVNPAILDENGAKAGRGWYTSPQGSDHVRSIYLIQKRTVKLPLMEAFDQADNSVSCACRISSTIAPQALTLLNSTFSEEIVRDFASRVRSEAGADSTDQFRRAYQIALQRNPTEEDIQMCRENMKSLGLEGICRVLINSNEFLYTD